MVEYLSIKSDPMPQDLIDLLLTYSADGTSRTIIEKELAIKHTEHIAKVDDTLWAMMDYYEDGTYSDDDFETLIRDIGTLNTEMAVLEMMLDKDEVIIATARAEAIPLVVPFGKGEMEDYESFMDWIALRKDRMDANRDWNTMNTSDIAELVASVSTPAYKNKTGKYFGIRKLLS